MREWELGTYYVVNWVPRVEHSIWWSDSIGNVNRL
jgi:hypothetical protein